MAELVPLIRACTLTEDRDGSILTDSRSSSSRLLRGVNSSRWTPSDEDCSPDRLPPLSMMDFEKTGLVKMSY
ncbi:hypothetical protein MHYP_G00295700 [Metynnis hypsauchen]